MVWADSSEWATLLLCSGSEQVFNFGLTLLIVKLQITLLFGIKWLQKSYINVTNCIKSTLPRHCVSLVICMSNLNARARHIAICPLTDIQVRLFHHVMCARCLWKPLFILGDFFIYWRHFLNHCFSCLAFGEREWQALWCSCAIVLWGFAWCQKM